MIVPGVIVNPATVHMGQALSTGLATVLAAVAADRLRSSTVCFSGRTYSELSQIVREFCAVAGRCRLPLVAADTVNSAQAVPHHPVGRHRPSPK